MQVYKEPLCRRHHSSVLSTAALYRAASFILAVVLSFLVAYATGGFWKKTGQAVIQPTVHYSGDGLLILEVRRVVGRAGPRSTTTAALNDSAHVDLYRAMLLLCQLTHSLL